MKTYLVDPLFVAARIPRATRTTTGTGYAVPSAFGNSPQTNAINVIASVAKVAKEHLLLVGGIVALIARLAVYLLNFGLKHFLIVKRDIFAAYRCIPKDIL